MIRALALSVLIACGGAPAEVVEVAPVSAAPVPSDSLYQLDVPMVDQHGAAVNLGVHRGHVTIVSMFYASCPMACPLLIEDVRALEAKLSPADRADVRVLLVSLDPARDTPEKMAEVVTRHGVDDARWTLARPAPDDVRPVAAVLGIAYRPEEGGEMDHSSILTVVDPEGRVIGRLDGLGQDPTPLLDAITRARPQG